MTEQHNPLEFLSGTHGGTEVLAGADSVQRLINVHAPQNVYPMRMGIQMWAETDTDATAANDSRCVLDVEWGSGQGRCQATVDVINGGTFVVCGTNLTVDARFAPGSLTPLATGSRRVSASLLPEAPASGAYAPPTFTTPRIALAVGAPSNLIMVPGFARRVTALHDVDNVTAAVPLQPTIMQVESAGSTVARTEAVRGQWIPLLGHCDRIRLFNSAGPAGTSVLYGIFELAL